MGADNDDELSDEVEAQIAAIDREFGLVPNRRVVESRFPNLAGRVNAAVVLHQRDPAEELVTVGRLELLGPLGEGGFGTVFKARDPELDRLVAVKLCPAWHPHAEEAVRREARALAKLRHPNIIAIHDVGRYEEEDALFLVTQYVQAVSLHAYAVRARRPWREILELFLTAGEALAVAHEAGVVHGDFKPQNVIVEEQTKTPYIVDFGLAHILAPEAEQLERAAKRGGTLKYMAPELLRGGRSNELTDLYAFCVSLWHCLDQQPPYVGDNTDELLEDIKVMAADVCFRDKTIPDRLRELLVVGLDQQPERRFANMRALLRELALLRGPVVVPPSPKVTPTPKRFGPIFGIMLLMTGAGVLGEFYIAHRSTTAANLPTVEEAREASELELSTVEEAQEASELKLPIVEEASELELPIEELPGPFRRAEEALAEGKTQECHDAWLPRYGALRAADAAKAGRLSLELAEKVAAAQPGCDAAPWIAVGAANAYEIVGVELTTDDLTGWEQAALSRTRAAELFTAANKTAEAAQQRTCIDLNDRAMPCSRLFQGSVD